MKLRMFRVNFSHTRIKVAFIILLPCPFLFSSFALLPFSPSCRLLTAASIIPLFLIPFIHLDVDVQTDSLAFLQYTDESHNIDGAS